MRRQKQASNTIPGTQEETLKGLGVTHVLRNTDLLKAFPLEQNDHLSNLITVLY